MSTFSMSSNGKNHNHNVSTVVPDDDVSILTESLLPITNYNDTVIPDQRATADDAFDTTTNNNNNNNNNISSFETPLAVQTRKYHSTCPPRFIPEVARNMSWNDPFYVNDNEVIAVFDLHPNMSCGRLLSWPGFCYIAFGGFFIVQLSSSIAMFDDISYTLTWSWFISVCVFMPMVQCLLRMERHRIRRGFKHVAIARRGIYVDECAGESPNNLILMRRTIIKYEGIKECYATSFLATFSYYDVAFKYKKGWFSHRRIHGNFETQKFVDIVNAMITESIPMTGTIAE